MRCSFCHTADLSPVRHVGTTLHACPACGSTSIGPDKLDEFVDSVRVDTLTDVEETEEDSGGPAPRGTDPELPVLTVEAERRAFSRLVRRERMREKLRARQNALVPSLTVPALLGDK